MANTDATQPVLRFENVTVVFDGVPVLSDVSFTVLPGETRIVFGAAGSGKTVMLKTAIGLVRPEAGRVHLFGQDITDLPERELFAIRHRVGILFQESALFDSLDIRDNVSYPLLNQREQRDDPARVEERVRESLRFVELEHTLDKFPSELSGGMRRRVGIARASVTQPMLMLYDSPTAGLDPITANTIVALIVKERDTRRAASMVVTHRYQDGSILANFRHDPATGELVGDARDGQGPDVTTKFMVFGEGRLVFEGTEAELARATDPYVAKFVRRNPYANGK